MDTFIERVVGVFSNSVPVTILTILILFALFYYTLNLLFRNNAKWLAIIFVVFTVATGLIFMFSETGNGIGMYYILVPGVFVLAVIIMFATEVRRDIWDIGTKKAGEIKQHTDRAVGDTNVNRNIDEIIKALQNMSKNDVGALIILANGNMPKTVIESGVTVDAEISSALIESIFFPKTPLHDGAMVINGNKIQAAGCFLPLSQEINIPKELGTRHRAGIGITETINVASLIVSEETGVISIAQGGKIKRYADSEMLRQTLKEYYWQELLGQKNN